LPLPKDSRIDWQGRRESNPQPAVLETAALPIELLPYPAHALRAKLLRRSRAVHALRAAFNGVDATPPEIID
jgi:hypothetical protein